VLHSHEGGGSSHACAMVNEELSTHDDQDVLSTLRRRVRDLEAQTEHLRDSEERLHILFEHAPDGYYLSDLKGVFIDGNSSAETITGYPRSELIGKNFLTLGLLSSADALRATLLLAKNRLGRSTGPDSFTLARKDGRSIPVEISTHPIRIGGQRLVLGIARDISRRRQIERDLRERVKELQAFYDLSDLAERQDASLDDLCRALAESLPGSWQHDDVAGARILLDGSEYRSKDFAESEWMLSAPILVGGRAVGAIDVCYLEKRPDADEGPFLTEERRLIHAIAERLGRIAERKQAEQALERSLALLAESQRIAHVGSWELDLESRHVTWSDEVYRIFGLDPHAVPPTYETFLSLVHPEDRAAFHAMYRASLRNRLASYTFDFRLIRPDTGELRVLHEQCIHEWSAAGRVVRSVGIVQDVTDRKRVDDYRTLGSDVLELLNTREPVETLLPQIVAAVRARIGADAVGLRLQEGEDYPYVAQVGFDEQFVRSENSLIDHDPEGTVCRNEAGDISLACVCGQVIVGKGRMSDRHFTPSGSWWCNDTSELLSISPNEDLRDRPRNRCVHEGYASLALIPIRSTHRPAGLLQLSARTSGFFTLDAIERLESVAAHIGEAIVRKDFEEKLARMARHDALTGVLNRYGLQEVLEREVARSQRYDRPIGLVMIDVNRFKEINDRFGHTMGDKVLKAVSDVLRHNVRESDVLVRYGGDEFLVILPETNGETVQVKARILAEVAERNRTNPLLDFPVTLSIGTSYWSPDCGHTIDQALEEADQKMYQDKRSAGPPVS